MICGKCEYENSFTEGNLCGYCGEKLVTNVSCSDVRTFIEQFLNVRMISGNNDTWYEFELPKTSSRVLISRSFITYLEKKFGYSISSMSISTFYIRKNDSFDSIWKEQDETTIMNKCDEMGIKYEPV